MNERDQIRTFFLPLRSYIVLVFAVGTVNVLLTTPMWVVNTRLKLQGAKFRNEDLQQTHYKGIFGQSKKHTMSLSLITTTEVQPVTRLLQKEIEKHDRAATLHS